MPRDLIARSVAAALLGLLVAAPASGLARYLAEREARVEAAVSLAATAVSASNHFTDRGLEKIAAEMNSELDLAVVGPGRADDFGIVRGAEVVLRRSATGFEASAAAAELLERYAASQSLDGEAAERGFAEVDGRSVVWATARLRGPSGEDAGLIRLRRFTHAPDDPAPLWRLVLAVLILAGAAGWGVSRSALVTCAPIAMAVALGGVSVGFVLVGGALATGLVYLFERDLTALLLALREQPTTYLYAAPAMIAMAVLVFVPFAMGIVLAFFDGEGDPVGLANFAEILDPNPKGPTSFYWTFGMTLLWTVSNVVLHVGIGLALALVLNRPDLRFRWVYRVLLIIPWAVPNYITALIWKWMFNTQYGAVNATLAIFGVEQIDWLGTSVATNFMANLVTNTWLGFPFMMVVALGALQSIPKDLYEAVTIDGASRWQSFRHVTLPLLKPALVPAVILGTIWTFNMFNVIYLVSGGGPDHQTNILITEAYDAFKVMKRYGYAAAYSLLIFVVLYAYGAMTNRITRATEGAFK